MYRLLLYGSMLVSLNFSAQTYNYYFGNLHAHTGFSDGNKDSLSSGVSRPDGSYLYAKASNDFDFLGISEHNHFSSNNNPGFEIQSYPIGLSMANVANQDGVFLSLFGIEYGVSSNYNGHVVVYGFNQLIGWEPGNYNIYNGKSDYDSLFIKVKNNTAAFCYLAHPYHTDFSSDGTYNGALVHAPYNATYDSAIVGLPLRSGVAFSQFNDYSDYATGDYISYYRQMLFKGYHLGIGYDHDNHYTNFGRSNGGRLVILAPSLTRANLVQAMQRRSFYGSDDSNAKIDFKLNGQVIGSRLLGVGYPTIQLIHNDPDAENADTIKIMRGCANTGTLWAAQVCIVNGNNTLQFTDMNIVPGKEYYYYAEIKQHDQQLIVTSPIWYKASTLVGTREVIENPVLSFPNPAREELHLSFRNDDERQIRILSLEGIEIKTTRCSQSQLVLDLQDLSKGLYILEVTSGSSVWRDRLLIN